MTRINIITTKALLDQHLMAEYRELPMVMASLTRSLESSKWDEGNIPKQYTLNKGHVSFFYNKKAFLKKRYKQLILELKLRHYNIDPTSRYVNFSIFDEVNCVEWKPTISDVSTNIERIMTRFMNKPDWYTYKGNVLSRIQYEYILKHEQNNAAT